MSATGSVSAGPAFVAQALPKKSLRDIPEMAFGKVKWEKYFGDIGVEPPLPPNIEEILNSPCPFWPDKSIQDTHLLVLIPETVNESAFHLDALGEMIQTPKAGHKTQYRHYWDQIKKELGMKCERSHWILMTRNIIPESRNKEYKKQKTLIKEHRERDEVHYEVPKVLEAATAILVHYVETGTRLYGDNPWTFTRCQEKVKVQKSRLPVAVGGLSSKGLRVRIYHDSRYGVAACGNLIGTHESSKGFSFFGGSFRKPWG